MKGSAGGREELCERAREGGREGEREREREILSGLWLAPQQQLPSETRKPIYSRRPNLQRETCRPPLFSPSALSACSHLLSISLAPLSSLVSSSFSSVALHCNKVLRRPTAAYDFPPAPHLLLLFSLPFPRLSPPALPLPPPFPSPLSFSFSAPSPLPHFCLPPTLPSVPG